MKLATKQKNGKKLFRNIVFFVIVALILSAAFAMIINAKKGRTPAFVFGKAFLWVETGSMKPVIDERSYILVTKYDGGEIKKGDVIIFVCKDASSPVYNALVAHRVESVAEDGLNTKGDANPTVDAWTVKKENIVAVYNKNLPVMTFLGRIFSSGAGLIIVIALSLGACAFVYVPDLIKAVGELCEEEKEKQISLRVKEEVARLERENEESRLKETQSSVETKPTAEIQSSAENQSTTDNKSPVESQSTGSTKTKGDENSLQSK